VSIVIPTYNRVGFVENAILSVLEQDYENLELLVLDDGSADETPRLLERIAERSDPRRFSWDRHENVGQSATLNRGFARMDGDLIGYLSSDDLLLPGAISALVAAAEANPSADVIYPWYRIDGLGTKPIDVITSVEHDFADALRWGICVPGVGTVVRRRFYERAGGWNEKYRHSPDVDWWLRLPDAEFLQVPEVLGVFTVHSGGISTAMDTIDYVNERLDMLDRLFEREDLPEEVRAVRAEAVAALLIEAGSRLLWENDIDNGRWRIEDLLGPRLSTHANRMAEASELSWRWSRESGAAQLDAAMKTIDHLGETVSVLEDTASWREQRILKLEAQIRAHDPDSPLLPEPATDAGAARPRWKRAIRRLVPPPLRPRAIATYRRLKGRT